MKKILFIFPLIFIIWFFGCQRQNKEIIHKKNYFKVNKEIKYTGINKNTNIIKVVDKDNKVSFWTLDGYCILDQAKVEKNENKYLKKYKPFTKENIIVDDVNNIFVCWDNKDDSILYFRLKDFYGVRDKSLYRRGKILNIDYIQDKDKSYYLMVLNNNKSCLYNYKGKRLKYRRINNVENAKSVNTNSLPNFYFVTEDGSYYSGNVNEQKTKKLDFSIQNSNIGNIYPLGADGFLVVYEDGYFGFNSTSNKLFENKFKENETFDSINIKTARNDNFVLIEKNSIFHKNNKKALEKTVTLFDLKNEKELWTKGSIFNPIDAIAVSNRGYVYIRDGNTIDKYNSDFILMNKNVFSGNISNIMTNEKFIIVVTDKNLIYKLKI